MNVIDGQAGIIIYSSLICYSLTIDNILNIIVLLILAGITVATLTGDNGLLTKAGEAKNTNIQAEGLERIQLAVMASYDNRWINTTLLAKNLSEINGIKYINSGNEEVDVTENTQIKLSGRFKLNGYNYKVSNEGKVTPKKDGEINNDSIKADPFKYYGKYVTNYNSLNDAGINALTNEKWQIFFADDTNIYLIASNQISKDFVPMNYTENSEYNLSFQNILSEYDTSNDENQSALSILEKLNNLPKYHEWLNTPSNLKNHVNEQAVLSMVDSDKWNEYTKDTTKKGYKNSKYASYVIGGPTLEMFCKSYNATHGGLEVKPRPKDDNNSFYTNGYKIQMGSKLDSWVGGLKATSQNPENIDISDIDNMLFICNYWLASPSASGNNYIMYISPDGGVSNRREYGSFISFRPVVCLKSDVNLIEKNNGSITTYELEED